MNSPNFIIMYTKLKGKLEDIEECGDLEHSLIFQSIPLVRLMK